MIRLLTLLLLTLATSASAQLGSGGGPVDPFLLPFFPSTPYGLVNTDTKSLTLGTQTLNPAVRNLVIIAAGSSNISNVSPGAYAPVHAAALNNFNITDGAIYNAVDPLLGCVMVAANPLGVGNPMLRVADVLVDTGKFDRVIIYPLGIGSANSNIWATGFASTRIAVALRRLAARGIVEGPNVTIVIAWGEGESDGPEGVTQTQYSNNLAAIIASTRAVGFTGRWFIAKQTWFFGAADASIQAAQVGLVNHGANIWAGPDADSLVGNTCSATPCRNAIDDTHWTDNGSVSYALGWLSAFAASGAPF